MNPMIKKRADSSATGFTLIEVLAVVAMMAALAAIAAPGWLAYLNNQRARAVQNDLVEVLRQTQTKAVQLRSDRTTTIDVNANRPTAQIGGLVQELGAGIKDGTFTMLTNRPDNAITFDYLGLPTSPDTTIPFIVTILPANSPADSESRRCVAVATRLGAIKTAKGSQCDVFLDIE